MDSERLRNKEVSKVNTWISLGRGNRIDVVGGLGEGGNGNRRNQARRDGAKSTGRDDLNWRHLGVM